MLKKNKNIKTDPKILRKNRNGIVVFENNEDLCNLFTPKKYDAKKARDYDHLSDCNGNKGAEIFDLDMETATEIYDSDYSALNEDQNTGIQKSSLEKRELKKNRHGLPFLDGGGSLLKMLTDAASAKDEKNFSELIETHLKGKNRDTMLREKSDRSRSEPVPLKKRLKRYPPPQDEMDLHGYTAKEAESRTESYLRNCWRNGLFTVQIIVGRGIHSPYGAVLPDVIEDLLTRLKKDGVLLWFEWDRRTKSQSGAAIAYLKQ